jgi:uncharacterized membrane protein
LSALHSERLVSWTLRLGAYGSFALLLLAAVLKIAGLAEPGMRMATWGILLLIATPTVRIIAALVMFAVQRDKKMVLVSVGVLLIVVLSSVAGMRLR